VPSLPAWIAEELRLRRAARAELVLSSVTPDPDAGGVVYRTVVQNRGRSPATDVVVHLSSGGAALARSDPFAIGPGEEVTETLVGQLRDGAAAIVGVDVAGLALLRARAPSLGSSSV
jgi:hypothetical protein